MRMLRSMCGVAKLDSVRNEIIRWTTKAGGEGISKKTQERRLKWPGHGMRSDAHTV